MDEQMMRYASFSGICKIMKNKDVDTKKCIQSVARLAFILFPGMSMTSIADLGTLETKFIHLDVTNLVNECIGSVKSLLGKQEDYTTRAENAQIANVLLVFSAFFDSIKQYLPDANREIALDDGEKVMLVEEALTNYEIYIKSCESRTITQDGKTIMDRPLLMPNPIAGMDDTQKGLQDFYCLLTEQFHSFVDKLSYYESLQGYQREKFEAYLRKLPTFAVECYQKQYYQLATEFPDFFIFSNQKEHADIQRAVDVGFRQIMEKIPHIAELYSESQTNQALEQLHNLYCSQVEAPLVDKSEMHVSPNSMSFPKKADAFVPQPFRALIYRQGIHLEHTERWTKCKNLGKFVADTLRSPQLGTQPMLILGDPGAGKTMLSHMLAARILYNEYHVIIVHLRDVVAEAEIYQQIDLALNISLDGTNCTWSEIRNANLSKPILLIFDGYDELLQASGKTHRNYIEKIASFQKNCLEIYKKAIRTIVTSRIVLIDKAAIPEYTPVVRLDEFDTPQVNKWCEIWNAQNESFFASTNLEKFVVSEESKAWKLAKQPLLLLMLALFDSNKNALRDHENLDETQLYYRLITDFIQREQNKDVAFRELQPSDQDKLVDDAMERISIAAIGMYNRNEIYIHSDQLQVDLCKIQNITSRSELQESDQLLGSFFFIHHAEAIRQENRDLEKTRAYAFLHNTFGEFLAAHYMVSQLQKTLHLINAFGELGAEQRIEKPEKWYSCLMYAPLFRRPVVLKMLEAWAPTYFRMKGMDEENVKKALNTLLDMELPKILNGSLIAEIQKTANRFSDENAYPQKDLMEHFSIYSFNLVAVCTALLKALPLSRFDRKSQGQDDRMINGWNQLRYLWRYSFGDEDMESITNMIAVGINNRSKVLHRVMSRHKKTEKKTVEDKIAVHRALDEEMAYSTLGALWGIPNCQITETLTNNRINRVAWTKLRCVVNNRRIYDEDSVIELFRVIDISLREDDVGALLCALLILRQQSENKGLPKFRRIHLFDPDHLLYIYNKLDQIRWHNNWNGEYLNVRCVILDILYHAVTPELENKFAWIKRIAEEIRYQRDFIDEGSHLMKLLGRLIEVSSEEAEANDKRFIRDVLRDLSHITFTNYRRIHSLNSDSFEDIEQFFLEMLHILYICKKVVSPMSEEARDLIGILLNHNWENSKFMVQLISYMLHIVVDSELLNEDIAVLLLRFIHENRVPVSAIFYQDNTAALELCKLAIWNHWDDAARNIGYGFMELVYSEGDRLSLQLIRQINRLANLQDNKMLRQAVETVFSSV